MSAPKEIARSLGLRPSAVAPLIRAAARRAIPAEPEVIGCWVSPRWRQHLRVDGHDDWPDPAPGPGEGSDGLVGVVVAQRERPHRSRWPATWSIPTVSG